MSGNQQVSSGLPETDRRRSYSISRLSEVKDFLESSSIISNRTDITIYATGSFGRLEACEESDLDLFILREDNLQDDERDIELRKELFLMAETLKFPPFTDDGAYLKTHNLPHLLEMLGGPTEDFENLFTARMLLLLESYCLHNTITYDRVISSVILSYFRDYDDH